jgi:hypothetical protein
MTLRNLVNSLLINNDKLEQHVIVRELFRGPNDDVISARECVIGRVSGTGDVIIEAAEWIDSKPI